MSYACAMNLPFVSSHQVGGLAQHLGGFSVAG
jgi:hypothetical protein